MDVSGDVLVSDFLEQEKKKMTTINRPPKRKIVLFFIFNNFSKVKEFFGWENNKSWYKVWRHSNYAIVLDN